MFFPGNNKHFFACRHRDASAVSNRAYLSPAKAGAAIALVSALAASLLLVSCGGKKSADERPVVTVTPADCRSVNIYGEYAGRVEAQQTVEVRARVEGYLVSAPFQEGSEVKKNQTLFIIDPAVYRAKASAAQARLARAEAQAVKARRDLDRVRPLFEQNAASQLDLDNAIAAAQAATADVELQRAELAQAQLTLGYTTVRSPITGRISRRAADIGTLVGPSAQSLLATVVKSDSVRIDFSMTALDYLRSKSRSVPIGAGEAKEDGAKPVKAYVTVTLADGNVYPYRGTVDFADPLVDPKTGTFGVRAEMPNPDRTLLPGEFTRVKMLLDVRDSAVVVPQKAVIVDKGGAFLYVLRKDSIVEKRFVETGPELDNEIVVERGLAGGENVVTEGTHKLRHGVKVLSAAVDSLSRK